MTILSGNGHLISALMRNRSNSFKPLRSLWTLAVLAPLSLGLACSTAPKPQAGPAREWAEEPAELKQSEASEYKKIQSLYEKGDYANALSGIIRFEKRHPEAGKKAQALNLHGLLLLKAKKFPAAIAKFRLALDSANRSGESSAYRQYVLYNLATAQYEARQKDETEKTLSEIQAENLVPETRLKFHYLKSLTFSAKGDSAAAAREILEASLLYELLPPSKSAPEATQTPVLPDSEPAFRKQLQRSVDATSDLPTLEELSGSYSRSIYLDLILFRVATRALSEKQTSKAERALRTLVTNHPSSIHYSAAMEQLRALQQQNTANARAIGVLLPMTGRFSRFGEQNLQAISLAFRIFNEKQPDSQVTLHIEDSGETPEQAIAALERLYSDHQVVAVLGPLLGKGIEQVTQRAQELRLPLISLSQKLGTKGDYVFQSTVTPKHQAYEIARYAIEQEGLRKFAILYPKDNFGEEYAQNFWDAVESMGGEITGVEFYPPGETDFRTVVDKLSGLFHLDARAREIEVLKRFREEHRITRKNIKTQQFFDLPPVVDYDAVFIPDAAKNVSQILPTFAYRDVDHVRYLGIPTWNSRSLFERAKTYVGSSIFVDAFYSQSESPEIRAFVTGYQSTFGEAPTALEAQTFDAASLLERALVLAAASGGSVGRSEVRDQLMSIRDFSGVTGSISYNDGEFTRRLKILRIMNNRVVDAGPGMPITRPPLLPWPPAPPLAAPPPSQSAQKPASRGKS